MKIAVSSDMVPYLCTRADKMTEINDIRTALDKISRAGYDGVTLDFSLISISADQLKECLDDTSLEAAGFLVKEIDSVLDKEEMERLTEACQALECRNICIDGIGYNKIQNEEVLKELCGRMEQAAAKAAQKGVALSLRPDAACFVRRNGRPVIEEILENTEMLMIQWNTYDMAVGGAYIPEWIEKTSDRISGIQFEEYQIDEESDTSFLECTHHMAAPEIGCGSLNWESILAACKKAEIGWCCVTTRKPERPIYDRIQKSQEYLKQKLLYRNLTD